MGAGGQRVPVPKGESTMTIGAGQVTQYERDGFLIVEGLLSDDDLQPVIDELAADMDVLARRLFEAGRITSTYADEGFYTRMAAIASEYDQAPGLFQISTPMGPELAALWSSDRLLDIVAAIIGPDIEGGAIWTVRPKAPENVLMTVPWHQDSGYLSPNGQGTAQPACWIPLLDVGEENGCLQVVRGGHRPGVNARHKVEKTVGDPRSWYLYIDEQDLPPGEIVTCAMQKGSALFIHENMPHRGLWNRSDHVRWAIDLRWQRPSDPTGLEGQLDRGPLMRKSGDADFRPDMMAWAREEREKYDIWVSRGDGDPLNPAIDGSWYFARWDPAFRPGESTVTPDAQ